jgi:hypothetical protein
MEVRTPSRVPNWESIPRVKRIRKKRTDHHLGTG